MKFIKLIIVYFCILISINAYANNSFYGSKYDINNQTNNNLYFQPYQESVNNDCESINILNYGKYVICK